MKDLHIEHVQNLNVKNKDLPNIKDLIKNDPIICVHYYEHKMISFGIYLLYILLDKISYCF